MTSIFGIAANFTQDNMDVVVTGFMVFSTPPWEPFSDTNEL
jgi:hypothetical protein